jgi:hypothetical protein
VIVLGALLWKWRERRIVARAEALARAHAQPLRVAYEAASYSDGRDYCLGPGWNEAYARFIDREVLSDLDARDRNRFHAAEQAGFREAVHFAVLGVMLEHSRPPA